MSKKITIEHVRKQFIKAGYQLLSTEYVNSRTKLEYRCPNGHYGSISWNHWQQGRRCPICAGNKKLTIELIQEQFAKEDCTLLTEIYINAHQKLEYICPKGHYSSICWSSWQAGHRCFECFGNKKPTIEFIYKDFAEKGYKLLTTKYINNYTKLEYICNKGHHCFISWNSWQHGSRCPICAILSVADKNRLGIEYIKESFAKEGYELLTKTYINSNQKLEYICPKGHRGSICWSNFQQGQRCSKCYFENNRGFNHPNFNPNLTEKDRQDRRLIPGYEEWAYNVKKRDNFTCQVCGKKGVRLNSHHLYSYASYPELQLVLSNGICICEDCHKLFHHLYGYGNNTKEQFEEFKENYKKEKIIKRDK